PCPDTSLGKRLTNSIIPGKRPLRANAGKFVSTISPTRSCIRCSSMAKKSTISTTGRQGGRGDRRGPGKGPENGTQIIIEIGLRPLASPIQSLKRQKKLG